MPDWVKVTSSPLEDPYYPKAIWSSVGRRGEGAKRGTRVHP